MRQRRLVDAFLAAARDGDFDALLAVLDGDVVLHVDATAAGTPTTIRGAQAVAANARAFSANARFAEPALVDGAVGIVVAPKGKLALVLRFSVAGDKITEIDIDADPRRPEQLRIWPSRLTHNAYVELLTGFGLATAAGLNAYIPLLALGLLSRFTDLVTLPHGWAWLENGWVMTIVAVLLVVEIVADKIPALDSINDAIQTFVRPTAGGIVFGSGTAAQTSAVDRSRCVRAVGPVDSRRHRRGHRAGGVADEVDGAARGQCRHRGDGRAGAVHRRGHRQRRAGLPGDPGAGAGAGGRGRAGVGGDADRAASTTQGHRWLNGRAPQRGSYFAA